MVRWRAVCGKTARTVLWGVRKSNFPIYSTHPTFVENDITIKPMGKGYLPFNDYIIYITKDVKSSSGKKLKNNVKMEFKTI